MGQLLDLTGKTFGRLTVVGRSDVRSKAGHVRWNCVCECGKQSLVRSSELSLGNTKSCGCLQKEKVSNTMSTHGMSKTKTYRVWAHMIERTTVPSCKAYAEWGGRGITVSDEWKTFENFLRDMGEFPKGLSLERVDNEAGYSKENCIWADRETQANNTRANHFITYDGKRYSLTQWSRILGVSPTTLSYRVKNWTPERVFADLASNN